MVQCLCTRSFGLLRAGSRSSAESFELKHRIENAEKVFLGRFLPMLFECWSVFPLLLRISVFFFFLFFIVVLRGSLAFVFFGIVMVLVILVFFWGFSLVGSFLFGQSGFSKVYFRCGFTLFIISEVCFFGSFF